MKKSRKIALGVVTGVVLATVAGALLGVFIPPLLSRQSLDSLVTKQVKPSEGNGNFQKYELNQELTDLADLPYSQKMQSIEDFSKKALNSETGFNKVISGLVSNYIIEFWKNYKNSAAYEERYDEWIDSINEQWDTEVSNYKKQYGSNWEYYFQLQVLDPVGGNESDWKRNKLIANVNTAFDDFMFSNYYINAMRKDGSDVITSFSTLTPSIQEYLISEQLVNGKDGDGTRNNIVFQPSKTQIELDATSLAKAKFQEFVFMEWVKAELPLITSMTLWKHVDPSSVSYNGYSFFNTEKINQIYSGTYSNLSTRSIQTRDDSSSSDSSGDSSSDGSSDSGDSGSSSGVSITASYDWQAFPVKSSITSSPDGNVTINATDKYNSFAKSFNNNYKNEFILGNTGGINIPVKYTDDSATLYFIKLSGGSNSVFNTSYTQYAAGATYKFNELLGITDSNVPVATALKTGLNGLSGTEIMSNFMSTSATTGYVTLPAAIQAGLNDDAQFNFKGFYNGVKAVTDTVNIQGTPFILTRNESGVHIIGIDRYEKIKAANSYEGKINEIANTLLWRYILVKAGMNDSNYLNNGFTSLDLETEIKNYYTNNRDKLLFKYICNAESANEQNKPKPEEYIFSNNFTSIPTTLSLSTSIYNDYINKFIAYVDYKNQIDHASTVKTKILELQNTNTLINKNYGNSVVSNGIGAMQPYTRDNTKNSSSVTWKNEAYVDETYGMYNSLSLFENLDGSTKFTNSGLKKKLDAVSESVNTLYTTNFASSLILKKLTYSSAKYNQYVLIGSQNPTSSMYYADDYEILNQTLNNWVTGNLETVKSIVQLQRSLAEINYQEIESTRSHSSDAKATTQSIFDANNFALTNSYQSLTEIKATPAIPTSQANSTDFVNYYLQKSYDTIKKLSLATAELAQYQGTEALDIDGLYQLARLNWIETILKDPYSTNALDFIQEVIGLKYAFDYNPKTNQYEFTKFKNYLIQQTDNNKKAAFVWVNEERNDLIKGYSDLTTDRKFSLKKYNAQSTDIHGYIYQGLNNVLTNYKDGDYFKTDFTFNDNTSYYTTAPVTKGSQNYVGFQGMVFESSTSTDIPSDALTKMFSSDLYVYNRTDDESAEPTNKGSMYNIGSRDNLIKEMENGIYTWDAVIKTQKWLNDSFDINTNDVRQDKLSNAREDLIKIVRDNQTKIPDSLFERNVGSVLATDSSLFNSSSMYFGDVDTPGAVLSQVVFTQFNQYDVIKLFDTNGDSVLDDNDVGINWTVANNDFLGTSADAFFIAAMNWYFANTSYKTTANANTDKDQPKFYTYDRRLNDLYGKDLLENYKESV